eukprot:m.1154298 g.1154298  ORF g.1154298 m.1154298 type:complete len:65 (-) comp24488_c0_seq20:3437-3631(-)
MCLHYFLRDAENAPLVSCMDALDIKGTWVCFQGIGGNMWCFCLCCRLPTEWLCLAFMVASYAVY